MSWETRNGRRYYYQARKVDGRVVKQYVGTGEFAQALASFEALGAERRWLEAEAERIERQEWVALDASVKDLCDLSDAIVGVVLALAGYHRHDRGEWRKR